MSSGSILQACAPEKTTYHQPEETPPSTEAVRTEKNSAESAVKTLIATPADAAPAPNAGPPEKIVKKEEDAEGRPLADAGSPFTAGVAAVKEEVISRPEDQGPPSHERWDQLLRTYVDDAGKVDYQSWKKDLPKLDQYLAQLRAHPVADTWQRSEQMAYWINAYNAFTVKLILDNYPLARITDLHQGNPWDVRWIQLGEQTYSLNNIENDILRPRYQDPRIHFAVNCAARSCPPLLNRAWTGENLEAFLEQQTKTFLNNAEYTDLKPGAVTVSKIFEWYAVDFGNLIDFLNRYAVDKVAADAKVTFREYDWTLNDQRQ